MKTGLVVFFALFSLSAPALALPALEPANTYDCAGGGVAIHYSTASSSGQPTILIHLLTGVISRSGDDIGIQDTVLGSLVTVERKVIPDLYTDTLTLIVPEVNVSRLVPAVFFNTRLFKTHTLTTVGGPGLVKGLITPTTSQSVLCKATAVHL